MVDYLTRPTKPNLAYIYDARSADVPVIVFLGGFRSDMMGTKAVFLSGLCEKQNRSYLRFDYSGHGQSEGECDQLCLGNWFGDVQDILHHALGEQKYILVGSSMGGWLSLLMMRHQPEQLAGFVGIAAAPDFTQWMEDAMTAAQKIEMQENGFILVPNDYGAPYVISRKLIEEGRAHHLLDQEINFDGTVYLLQGKADMDVPWKTAERIKSILPQSDTHIIYIEDGNHSLSAPDDLEKLAGVINAI